MIARWSEWKRYPTPLRGENIEAPIGPGLYEVAELTLSYRQGHGAPQVVLALAQLAVAEGETVAITGPSGCGKTTLLQVLSGLERPQSGRVCWGEVELTVLGEAARDRWRRQRVGFVFQDFHLIPGLTALANVLLPVHFERWRVPAGVAHRAHELLERVGLGDGSQPVERLSRGEMQRVAVARALLFRPPVVLADEPTASLDAENGRAVTELLFALAAEQASTVIVVSHDPVVLGRADAVYRMHAGHLTPFHLRDEP